MDFRMERLKVRKTLTKQRCTQNNKPETIMTSKLTIGMIASKLTFTNVHSVSISHFLVQKEIVYKLHAHNKMEC